MGHRYVYIIKCPNVWFETSLLDTFRYDFKSAAVGNDSTMFLERVNVPLGKLSSYPKLLSGRGLLVIYMFVYSKHKH